MSAPRFFDDLGATLADVEEMRYTPFIDEPGEYPAKVSKIEDAVSKKDDPQIIIYYEITEGPHKGQEVRDYFTYTRDRTATDKDGNNLFERQLGWIKARFVDLGMPQDHKGGIDRSAFDGVPVILIMRASKQINEKTGKPYINIAEVVRRDRQQPAQSAPEITPPSNAGFFS